MFLLSIQSLLNERLPKSFPPLRVDGRCGQRTVDTIRKAQQILGENFRRAGYSSVSDFVRVMGDIRCLVPGVDGLD